MSFLAPLMFAFGLAAPAIVALYLLKLKRERIEIPSTLLWMRSIQDMTANAPFQKLRNNLLLWLQLLVALLAMFALARPFLALDTTRNQTVLVLVDNSASMQATDMEGYPTRLDQARAMARDLIDNLGPDDAMLIATFNSRTQTLVSAPTSDARELTRAVNSIEPTDRPTDIRDGLVLVESLLGHVPNPEVVVISDGALGEHTDALLEMAGREDGPPVRYLRCGSRDENTGIIAFSISRALEDQRRVEIYAEAANGAESTEVTATLELFLDDSRIDAKSLTLPPFESRGVVFSNVGDISGALELRLNLEDDLPIDNVAYGILSPQRDLRVLLVSERENLFMTSILQQQDALRVSRVEPAEYNAEAAPGQFDLIILEGFCPDPLPEGNYIILGAPKVGIPEFEAAAELLAFPPVVDWDRRSPLTRFADFSLVTVERAIDYRAPSHAHTLVETNAGPLISLIERGAMNVLYVGFDIYRSDWPMLVSFPVFITNAVQHFRGKVGSTGQFVVPTGEAIIIPLPAGTENLSVTTPGGTRVPINVAPGAPVHYYTNTDRAGIYRVDVDGREIEYAVSLLDPGESRIDPAADIGDPQQGGLEGGTEVVNANTEIWRPLAWAALLVLMLEWFIYLRRTWL
jgi:hypothetical protein